MGPLDDNGIMGGMFDLNHDGHMDGFERAVEMQFLMDTFEESEDNDDGDFDDEMAEHLGTMEDMDDDEREEYMEENDFDPDDYDFDF